MGVPQELVNLAIVESRFQPDAVSHKGAVGLWQFMSATARSFGLRVPPARRLAYLDERRDPILSTFAAARFLRHLYEEFGCWHLALAAYNSGLGNVNRAIGRAKKYDFWSLARRGLLAKETADFVPRFIAVTLIMSNPKRYGFNALS
jgi:membrane-bound lytic murein transglycosylase D